jgi:hypothetical protein
MKAGPSVSPIPWRDYRERKGLPSGFDFVANAIEHILALCDRYLLPRNLKDTLERTNSGNSICG